MEDASHRPRTAGAAGYSCTPSVRETMLEHEKDLFYDTETKENTVLFFVFRDFRVIFWIDLAICQYLDQNSGSTGPDLPNILKRISPVTCSASR